MPDGRRLGRPPATSSEETRSRILDAARHCFARNGYEATTNRQLADAAGLTTGAIYHYFGSKVDLYIETHSQVQALVYERFERAVEAASPTFVARLTAVLDEALALNHEDPTLAEFLVAVRTDMSRHDELGVDPRLAVARRESFFADLVDLGISTGELSASDRDVTRDVIVAMLMGLVSASSGDPETHARAIGGMKRLLAGSLVGAPSSAA